MERLRKLRTKRNLTQDQLASKMGVARNSISRYEKNEREPDYETLKRLADFFDVSTDYLLDKTDDPTPPAKRGQKKEAPEGASDNDIKFALFDGASGEITDEMYEDVKKYVEFLKSKNPNEEKSEG